jgi:hypothetical protein
MAEMVIEQLDGDGPQPRLAAEIWVRTSMQ